MPEAHEAHVAGVRGRPNAPTEHDYGFAAHGGMEVRPMADSRTAPRHPHRRLGAVLGVDDDRLRVWINGVTETEGEWVPKASLPPCLHADGSTFDVFLDDGQPIATGAYGPQLNPRTWEPWPEEVLFGVQ